MKRIIALALAILTSLSLFALASCDKEDNEVKENDMYLVLVNKTNTVGEDFVPEGLVDIDTAYTNGGKNIQLDGKTAEAAITMLDAMKAAGITNTTITSGYRTYAYQKTLFDRYCGEEKDAHPTWSDEEVKDYVLT